MLIRVADPAFGLDERLVEAAEREADRLRLSAGSEGELCVFDVDCKRGFLALVRGEELLDRLRG